MAFIIIPSGLVILGIISFAFNLVNNKRKNSNKEKRNRNTSHDTSLIDCDGDNDSSN